MPLPVLWFVTRAYHSLQINPTAGFAAWSRITPVTSTVSASPTTDCHTHVVLAAGYDYFIRGNEAAAREYQRDPVQKNVNILREIELTCHWTHYSALFFREIKARESSIDVEISFQRDCVCNECSYSGQFWPLSVKKKVRTPSARDLKHVLHCK